MASRSGKTQSIWIVEMFSDVSRRYEPTVGAGLTRNDGRLRLKEFQDRNPADRFRLKKYMRPR